jgi:hypothetical protein
LIGITKSSGQRCTASLPRSEWLPNGIDNLFFIFADKRLAQLGVLAGDDEARFISQWLGSLVQRLAA